MYWEERVPETERIRIRDVRDVVWERALGLLASWFEGVGFEVEEEARRAFVYVKARVRAPERETEGVFAGEGAVAERRFVRERRRVDWTSRNGR